jgi:hypothetical protein
MGPNGVVEEEFQEKDSRTGKETKRHSRGVGEKVHVQTMSSARKHDLSSEQLFIKFCG